jgi:hypothetical protein
MLLHHIIVLKIKMNLVKKTKIFISKFIIFFLSIEYTRECGYDEPLFDTITYRNIECDTLGRCPMNSYCNTQTNRCCVKGK